MSDSPVFGAQRPVKSSPHKNITLNIESNSSNWYVTSKPSKSRGHSTISTQLKMSFALLTLQKNLKILSHVISKSINKNKSQSFRKIQSFQNKKSQHSSKGNNKYSIKQYQNTINPQKQAFQIICIERVKEMFQKVIRISQRYKLKLLLKSYNRILITSGVNFALKHQLRVSSCVSYNERQPLVSSNPRDYTQQRRDNMDKKNPNSKKIAKQMKQNSSATNNSTDIQIQNQKIYEELSNKKNQFSKFQQGFNSLIAYHQKNLAEYNKGIGSKKPIINKKK